MLFNYIYRDDITQNILFQQEQQKINKVGASDHKLCVDIYIYI